MHARLLGTGLVVLTLVAGCSSEVEGPSVLPRVTASPSPSPSAAEVVVVPTAAQAATPQGAAAFARFWFDTLNSAARTGDTAALRSISDTSCDTCLAFVKSIEGLYGPGGRIEGGVFTVHAAEAPGLAPEAATARVTVIYDVSATRQLGVDGEELAATPALEDVDADMHLVRVAGQWKATDLVTQP